MGVVEVDRVTPCEFLRFTAPEISCRHRPIQGTSMDKLVLKNLHCFYRLD